MAAEVRDPADLYALPLEEFTGTRNELSARLRKAGDRAGADAVKKLSKPSITAWALNQVARRQPKAVERLLSAGADLAKAQQALLAGRPPAAFRDATQAQRQAVADLLRDASAVLEEDGHPASKATLDRLEATLRAAAAVPDGAALLREGRLTHDLDPSGFGFGMGETPREPIPFPAKRVASASAKASEKPSAEKLEQAQETVRGLRQQMEQLRARAAEAEREAAAARAAAHKADRALAEARDAAAKAEREAERAHEDAEEAATALSDLRASIDRAAEALEQAQDDVRQLRQP